MPLKKKKSSMLEKLLLVNRKRLMKYKTENNKASQLLFWKGEPGFTPWWGKTIASFFTNGILNLHGKA